jgi:hypothetical protein
VCSLLAVDALYRSFTVEDTEGLHGLVSYDDPTEPWWWRRIPASGAIRAEIDQIGTAVKQRRCGGHPSPPTSEQTSHVEASHSSHQLRRSTGLTPPPGQVALPFPAANSSRR